jgi:hypothetical protein
MTGTTLTPRPLYEAVKRAGTDPRMQYLAFFGVWVLEREFEPKHDHAVRDWARTSKPVAMLLREVDDARIALRDLRLCRDRRGDARALLITTKSATTRCTSLKAASIELAPYYADILTGHRWV